MATVVNARDVYLQAYSPRVNTVQISDNVTVDSSQIIGDGITIVGQKRLSMKASSQIIKHYTSGGDDISSITLTIVPTNLTGTATLSIISGSVSGTHSFGDGYSVTINTSDIVSDVVQFKGEITQDSVTYYDYVTVIRSRESSSTVNTYGTNDWIVIPADTAGNPLSYSDATGTFKLWQGTYDITTSYTFSVLSNPNSLTASINTSGVYTISAGMAAVSSATVTFRAVSGASTKDLVVTLTKIGGSYTGVRSARTYSVPLNNFSLYSDTLATLVVTQDGGPILGDVVTEYDTSGSYTETKFWTGASWKELNAFVDGNLLVKGTVTADALSVNSLDAVTGNMGDLTVDGTLTVASTGEIVSSDYSSTSGFKIVGGSGSYITINNGNIGGAIVDSTGIESDNYIEGTPSGAFSEGWRLDNSNGKIYASSLRLFEDIGTGLFTINSDDGEIRSENFSNLSEPKYFWYKNDSGVTATSYQHVGIGLRVSDGYLGAYGSVKPAKYVVSDTDVELATSLTTTVATFSGYSHRTVGSGTEDEYVAFTTCLYFNYNLTVELEMFVKIKLDGVNVSQVRIILPAGLGRKELTLMGSGVSPSTITVESVVNSSTYGSCVCERITGILQPILNP